MIKLIDLLKEVVNNNTSKLIYHFTSFSSAEKIIQSDRFNSSEAERFFEYDETRILPEYKNVLFFTQDENRFNTEGPSDQCVLVLDGIKLSKDYKVISYGDPYEEVVVYTNDKYIPLHPYLNSVIVKNTLQKSKKEKFIKFLEDKNIKYSIDYSLETNRKEYLSKLPELKKQFVSSLIKQFPNGFIGYLNTPLSSSQEKNLLDTNSYYSYPTITINEPGKYALKSKFLVKFKIEPKNYEKYINWYVEGDNLVRNPNILNSDNYNGMELYLKGEIKIDSISYL